MTRNDEARKNGLKPWLRFVLIASLALNMLTVGMIGGAAIKWSQWRGHHPPRLDQAGGPLTRALTQEDRREIGRRMRAAYRESGKKRGHKRAEMAALVEDLKAQPFDAEAVRMRLARQRAVFDERLALGQALLLERLTQMSDAERAAYAGRLSEALERHKHRHRDKKRQEKDE